MEMNEVIEIVKSVKGVSEERKNAVITLLEGVAPERRALTLEMNGFPSRPVSHPDAEFFVLYKQGDATEYTEVPCTSYEDALVKQGKIHWELDAQKDPYKVMAVMEWGPGEDEYDVIVCDSTYDEDYE